MEPQTTLDLIRHGEPDGGVRYRGHRDDPLSPQGWQQMNAAIHADDRWDLVISSPLQRCQAFAQSIAEQQSIPLLIDSTFKEMSFGEWEGLTPIEVGAIWPDQPQAFWQDARQHPAPGSEPINDFAQRVANGLHQCLDQHAGQRLLLVAHGGVIRMALAAVLGIPANHAMRRLRVPYACRTRLQHDALGTQLVSHGHPFRSHDH